MAKPSTVSLKRMEVASQAWLSVSWNADVPGSKRLQAHSDSRNVTMVVASAAERAFERISASSAAQRQDKGRPDERDDEEAGQDSEAEHQCAPTPVTRYQEMMTATPISMTKA